MTSIFQIISDEVIDGRLPEDFSLSDQQITDEIVFADGAMDGISIYHMNYYEMDEESLQIMEEAVRRAGAREFDVADELFLKLAENNRAVYVVDPLQSYITDNRDNLDDRNVFDYAVGMLYSSENAECVKYALSMLALFELEYNEALKDAIRTIGLCDEFTLFSIFVVRHWEHGNEEVFNLAQKVHGWGRIHAVDYLQPDSGRIRKWLLLEGVHNNVLPEYSALKCWESTDAERILRAHPTREEFTGIRDILCALARDKEGPVGGLSELDNKEEIVQAFISESERFSDSLTEEDHDAIRTIREYFEEVKSEGIRSETLDILTEAISDVGVWRWWCLRDDDVVEEFGEVQLYDDTKPEKGPHTSALALKFSGNTFALFMDNYPESDEKPWYERLGDDESEPFEIEYGAFGFNDPKFTNEVLDFYKNKNVIKELPGEDIVSAKYILTAKCGDVGFFVGGDEMEIKSHRGVLSEDEVKELYDRWYEYWKDYWNKRGTKDAYEKDYACEVTIPVGNE